MVKCKNFRRKLVSLRVYDTSYCCLPFVTVSRPRMTPCFIPSLLLDPRHLVLLWPQFVIVLFIIKTNLQGVHIHTYILLHTHTYMWMYVYLHVILSYVRNFYSLSISFFILLVPRITPLLN